MHSLNSYKNASSNHKQMIDELLSDTRANNGLGPVDLERFWQDQNLAIKDCFNADQCAFGAILNWECIFDELGIEQNWWRFLYEDRSWALGISKRYNDLSEKIVGRRLLPETLPNQSLKWPDIKELYDIFESKNVWEGGANGSWWLKEAAHSVDELKTLLDRVEKRLDNLRDFMLPENWDEEKTRLMALNQKHPLYRTQRGPCTFATSVFGTENMLFLFYDDPGLFKRFSELIGRAIIERAKILDEEAGFTLETAPHGWRWYDDNCCLYTPEMYESFAMPIHRAVFKHYAPNKEDNRFQHSDSNMAHLLPLINELDLSGSNFGPTLTVTEIRKYCPNAVIFGQMAPFTYSSNEESNILAEFLRDFDQSIEKRGLCFATAGSINNGSRLTGMRLLMAAIQHYGRY